MTSGDSTGAPLPDESLYVAFLNDLDAAKDAQRVIHEYSERHPHLAGEWRAMAEMRRTLDRSKQPGDDVASQPERLGDFRIIRRIARGGMGEIYEAIQEPLGRRVAVKTIRGRHRHLTGPLHDRFLREQTVLARLHHTHIVPIHAAGREGVLQYFAMSYIDGAALHHVVRTARIHGSSSARRQTPTLAVLAAEAQSHKSPESQSVSQDQARTNGEQRRPAADAHTDATEPLGETPPVEIEQRALASAASAVAVKGNGKLVLSAAYFSSVARVMIDAAEALQHAHDAGIIHRDLKPANLMVDIAEHCWVLDFGLAGYLKAVAHVDAPGSAAPPAPGITPPIDLGPELDPPTMSGVLGTPDYMAPEQFEGRADARTDVWGLGVVLYELLTLSRPFSGRREIASSDPPRPSDLVDGLPLDLEAICGKAVHKDPAKRYQTARGLAADLRHWQNCEPVTARPARTPRRVLLWAKRNKGWATAITLAAAAFLTVGSGAVYVSKARADAAQREAQTQRREVWIQQMQRLRMTYQYAGWSRVHWDMARRAAAIQTDPRIQGEAAGSLAGLDVEKRKWLGFPATALVFSPSGKHLVIGGSHPFRHEAERPIQVWDRATDQLRAAETTTGSLLAFGFASDGSPLVLNVPDREPATAQLWDLTKARLIRNVKAPLEGKSAIRAIALTPDGARFAASARHLKDNGEFADKGAAAVWEAGSGREIFRSATTRATEIALAADASLLAAGHEDGRIMIWSLPKGEVAATFKADRNELTSLAFGRDPVRLPGSKSPGSGWLLAAGDHGGTLAIWDLGEKVLRSIGHNPSGSPEILALAFSPDGMTLTSAGRGYIVLWDIPSGQPLLATRSANYSTALAFSPDGTQLAAGGLDAFGSGDGVGIYELEQGRGIGSLRGLRKPVIWITISGDSRLVAALSNDWRVGIWDRAARRLLHVLEVTPGFHTDNAALAFSPDGRQLTFSAGREASLWDVAAGELIKSWKLFPGKLDQLAFPQPNRLLLFRVETESGELGPFGDVNARRHPRVCRIRDLLGPEPQRPLAEIRDCNIGVMGAACSRDGRYYAVEGLGNSLGRLTRVANLYDGATGKKLGALPSQHPAQRDFASFSFDATGTVLRYCYKMEQETRTYFLSVPSLAITRDLDGDLAGLGPQARQWLMHPENRGEEGYHEPGTLTLFEQGRPEPLVRFGLGVGNAFVVVGRPQFSPDGQHIVWGSKSGVTVVDLVEVNRRLSELGLGW